MAENKDKKREQFGNRVLTNPDQVFQHNAWDNVEWDEEQEQAAKKKVLEHSQKLVDDHMKEQYEVEADRFWDEFYTQHQNRFFKDRHWLFTEFPELLCGVSPMQPDSEQRNDPVAEKSVENSKNSQSTNVVNEVDVKSLGSDTTKLNEASVSVCGAHHVTSYSSAEESERREDQVVCDSSGTDVSEINTPAFPGHTAKSRIFEVGCGVGNTVFPVLQTNNDPKLFMYCCDLSSTAIQLVKEHRDYNSSRCHAFVCDVTDMDKALPFPDNSLDVITLIFVMSAIHPDKMQTTIDRLAAALKPGGQILFRDYGRYDMAQLRFKNGRCLSENFYVRGDGTRVYFFTQEEVRDLFVRAGLTERQNHLDRRLQVNRGKMLKMYRVWIQCKYQKHKVDS